MPKNVFGQSGRKTADDEFVARRSSRELWRHGFGDVAWRQQGKAGPEKCSGRAAAAESGKAERMATTDTFLDPSP